MLSAAKVSRNLNPTGIELGRRACGSNTCREEGYVAEMYLGRYCNEDCAESAKGTNLYKLTYYYTEAGIEECWPWEGEGSTFVIMGQRLSVQEAIWLREKEQWPTGHKVISTCGNQLCCNINHLTRKPDLRRSRV